MEDRAAACGRRPPGEETHGNTPRSNAASAGGTAARQSRWGDYRPRLSDAAAGRDDQIGAAAAADTPAPAADPRHAPPPAGRRRRSPRAPPPAADHRRSRLPHTRRGAPPPLPRPPDSGSATAAAHARPRATVRAARSGRGIAATPPLPGAVATAHKQAKKTSPAKNRRRPPADPPASPPAGQPPKPTPARNEAGGAKTCRVAAPTMDGATVAGGSARDHRPPPPHPLLAPCACLRELPAGTRPPPAAAGRIGCTVTTRGPRIGSGGCAGSNPRIPASTPADPPIPPAPPATMETLPTVSAATRQRRGGARRGRAPRPPLVTSGAHTERARGVGPRAPPRSRRVGGATRRDLPRLAALHPAAAAGPVAPADTPAGVGCASSRSRRDGPRGRGTRRAHAAAPVSATTADGSHRRGSGCGSRGARPPRVSSRGGDHDRGPSAVPPAWTPTRRHGVPAARSRCAPRGWPARQWRPAAAVAPASVGSTGESTRLHVGGGANRGRGRPSPRKQSGGGTPPPAPAAPPDGVRRPPVAALARLPRVPTCGRQSGPTRPVTTVGGCTADPRPRPPRAGRGGGRRGLGGARRQTRLAHPELDRVRAVCAPDERARADRQADARPRRLLPAAVARAPR